MEIERKFLVERARLPKPQPDWQITEMVQAYISVDPVIRIRKENNDYVLTVKGDGLLQREEFELPLTQQQFNQLYQKIDTHTTPIHKTRYTFFVEHGESVELDVYAEQLSGLYTVEVEFETIDQAHAFNVPEWFGQEVTQDARFSNARLSKDGIPRKSPAEPLESPQIP